METQNEKKIHRQKKREFTISKISTREDLAILKTSCMNI